MLADLSSGVVLGSGSDVRAVGCVEVGEGFVLAWSAGCYFGLGRLFWMLL